MNDDALLDLTYRAPTDDALWPVLLTTLSARYDTQFMGLVVRRTDVPDSFGLLFGAAVGIAMDSAEYRRHYHTVDTSRQAMERRPVGTIRDALTPRTGMGDPSLRAFHQRYPVRPGSGFGALVARSSNTVALLSAAYGTGSSKCFFVTEHPDLPVYLPHLRRAIELRLAFGQLQLQMRTLEEVAHRAAASMLVLEHDRRVLFANASAQCLLAHHCEATIAGGVLVGRSTAVERQIAAATTKAFRSPPVSSRLAIGNLQSRRTLDMFVAPLPVDSGFTRGLGRRLALAVIPVGESEQILPLPDDLCEIFDFTRAEARVAIGLCRGKVAKDIAGLNGVTIATVRTQLRAVFAKTGTSRQAELVQLISAIPRRGRLQ